MHNTLIYGCMGLGGGWNNNPVSQQDIAQTHGLIDTALDCGISMFDHADIYAKGKAEEVFGRVLAERKELRAKIHLQTKCGIRFEDGSGPKRYDFSREWIYTSVENSLKRLATDYIDCLMLHRPDALVDVTELRKTFEELYQSGKVRQFAVSNMHRHQIALLQAHIDVPIVANQLEFSLLTPRLVTDSLFFNSEGATETTGTLEYCHQHGLEVQAWASLGKGKLTGAATKNEQEKLTAKKVEQYAAEYAVSPEAIVIAWLQRLPVKVSPVLGTTNMQRLRACAQANNITLSREHWYDLLITRIGRELP